MSTNDNMTESETAPDSDSAAGTSKSVTDSDTLAEGVRITLDGGVVKHILQEGSGDFPPLHARCLGAYAYLPSV